MCEPQAGENDVRVRRSTRKSLKFRFVELITCSRSIHRHYGSTILPVSSPARSLNGIVIAPQSATIANFTVVIRVQCIACSINGKRAAMSLEQMAFYGQRASPTGKNNSISIWCEHSFRLRRCICKIDRIVFHHRHRIGYVAVRWDDGT